MQPSGCSFGVSNVLGKTILTEDRRGCVDQFPPTAVQLILLQRYPKVQTNKKFATRIPEEPRHFSVNCTTSDRKAYSACGVVERDARRKVRRADTGVGFSRTAGFISTVTVRPMIALAVRVLTLEWLLPTACRRIKKSIHKTLELFYFPILLHEL